MAEDSTFYGDLFAHVVQYRGKLYLEDGPHRALRAALSSNGGDALLHARIHVIDPDCPETVAAPNRNQVAPALGPGRVAESVVKLR